MKRVIIFLTFVFLACNVTAFTDDDTYTRKISRVEEIFRISIVCMAEGRYELRVLFDKDEYTEHRVQGVTKMMQIKGVYYEFDSYDNAYTALMAIRKGEINCFMCNKGTDRVIDQGKIILEVKQFQWYQQIR